ncbi:MAG: ATP-binding cassette domain-containing protein [Clostridia bacterium]|nr:ATP-binding cassette domain-containing protein [Clostridia bacterium]
MQINVKNLTKSYGENRIFENFNLSIEKGKITVVLGESGSGKTTLLKMLANLTDYSGKITNNEKSSFIFQEDRLVKNLTVNENLKLFCKNCDCSSLLEEVKLKGCENKLVGNLSGGMSRRVAIVRGLVVNAPMLLMDEPFTNLDLSLKYSLIKCVKKMHEKKKNTIIMVTHDIKEAVLMADRVIVLSKGKIKYDNKKITPNTEKELFEVMININ